MTNNSEPNKSVEILSTGDFVPGRIKSRSVVIGEEGEREMRAMGEFAEMKRRALDSLLLFSISRWRISSTGLAKRLHLVINDQSLIPRISYLIRQSKLKSDAR